MARPLLRCTSLFVLCTLALAAVDPTTLQDFASATPEQVHIALTENAGEMRVSWATMEPPDVVSHGICAWGTTSGTYPKSADAEKHTYKDGGFNGTLHSCVMTGLISGERYVYIVKTTGASSGEFTFRYVAEESTLSFLAYGDMGIKNSAYTNKMVTEDAKSGKYDLLVNVGDTSYADDYKDGSNAYVFDRHFNEIQGYASRMPFMAVPGNHDAQYNFSGYRNRLKMPVVGTGPLKEFYYSFNYGPVHFLVYSSEHPFDALTEQHEFIKADLKTASMPANRRLQPWIVMWSHRPLYCSDEVTWKGRCITEATEYRKHIESLMADAHVDLHLSGHNHQYERSWPVTGCDTGYTTNCQIETPESSPATISQALYKNPKHTVHIVNGAAGDIEGSDPTWIAQAKVPFRAAHDKDLHTGYGRVTANSTMLSWDFVYSGSRAIPYTNSSDGVDAGVIADSFSITKDEETGY